MIVRPYDISTFIVQVQDKDKGEIIYMARREVAEVRKRSFSVKGAVKARKQGSIEYAELLKGLIFFLSSEMKPLGVSDWDFRLFRPLCEKLVKKGQLKSETLELFED